MLGPRQRPMNSDHLRPHIHYSPPRGWLNDPCGLVALDGQFHLYYQHNPHDNRWGPMHWGHAVSPDFFHWNNRPVAATPHPEIGMAFTGSAVAATGPEGQRLAALYTAALPLPDGSRLERQWLARSRDGTRWEPEAEVISNPGLSDFRDPALAWHPGEQRWYAALAAGSHIRLYTSPDLRSWSGPRLVELDAGGTGAGTSKVEWECPVLVSMPGDPDEWLLGVHLGRGMPISSAGAHYVTGRLGDGSFHPLSPLLCALDAGHDLYALQPWSGTADRRVWIGWAAHYAYADTPRTGPDWAGVLSLPRELSLGDVRDADGRVLRRVSQRPVRELYRLPGRALVDGRQRRWQCSKPELDRGALHLRVRAAPAPAGSVPGVLTIRLIFGQAGWVEVVWREQTITVDRSELAMGGFERRAETRVTRGLPRPAAAPSGAQSMPGTGDDARAGQELLELVCDRSILEVFAAAGFWSSTDVLYPEEPLSGITLEADRSVQLWARLIAPTMPYHRPPSESTRSATTG